MPEYKMVWLDADTPLLTSALHVQDDYIKVTCKLNGNTRKFKNRTAFWGHHSKKSEGWLADINNARNRAGKTPYQVSDFDIEDCVELREDIADHMEEAIKQWDFYIGRIKSLGLSDNYRACIGGEGNFRYDLAQQRPYKEGRAPKPALFYELREEIISKYKGKIQVVDGCEADDFLAQVGWENYQKWKRTGNWHQVIGFIDKDLGQIIGPYFNFNDENPKVKIRTIIQAARSFCIQMLTGDSTDKIIGLPGLPDHICEKYNIRKGRGVGEKKAHGIIDPCKTPKEMFERVVECYKAYYGIKAVKFKSHRGEDLCWNYLDYLEENAGLLWLRRDINKPYSITESLDRLGIDPEKV